MDPSGEQRAKSILKIINTIPPGATILTEHQRIETIEVLQKAASVISTFLKTVNNFTFEGREYNFDSLAGEASLEDLSAMYERGFRLPNDCVEDYPRVLPVAQLYGYTPKAS